MYRDGFRSAVGADHGRDRRDPGAPVPASPATSRMPFALESQQKAEAARRPGRFDARDRPGDESPSAARRSTLASTSTRGPARRSRGWRSCRSAFPQVEGQPGHHHRRLVVRHHRRRRGRGARHRRVARSAGLRPLARSSAGPAPASIRASWASARCRRSQKLKARSGLGVDDVDLVELNEAFAAQVLAVTHATCRSRADQLNVNGGAIALGHPIGCTGDAHCRDPAARAAAPRRLAWHRDAVRQRRHGHGARPGGDRVTCRSAAPEGTGDQGPGTG